MLIQMHIPNDKKQRKDKKDKGKERRKKEKEEEKKEEEEKKRGGTTGAPAAFCGKPQADPPSPLFFSLRLAPCPWAGARRKKKNRGEGGSI